VSRFFHARKGFARRRGISGRSYILEVLHQSDPLSNTSFTRGKELEFKCSWKFSPSHVSVVNHLEWSPWVEMSPSSTPRYDTISLLALSTDEGSVRLVKVAIDSSHHETVEISTIQERDSSEVLPKQRLAVTKLAWKRRDNNLILAIARNGILTLDIHSLKNTHILISEMISCRHGNFSPVAGILYLKLVNIELLIIPASDSLEILLLSQLLPIAAFVLSQNNELSIIPSPTGLQTFFQTKNDTYSTSGTKTYFKVLGVNASYNKTVISIFYELILV
jgi:hypothetical protein